MYRCSVFLAVALCCLAKPAQADSVLDTLTVFNAAGAIIGEVGVTEGGVVFGLHSAGFGITTVGVVDPAGVYYINDPTLADPAQFGNFTTLVDASRGECDLDSTSGCRAVVGVVSPTPFPPPYFLGFSTASLAEGTPLGPFAPSVLPADGPLDITLYLNPSLQALGYHATFTPLPEPGTVGVLSGLAALGLVVGKRLRRN